MWLWIGALVSLAQLAVFHPAQLVSLLFAALRLCGCYCFAATNDQEQHPQVRWLEWLAHHRGACFGRLLHSVGPQEARCMGGDLRRLYGDEARHQPAGFALGSGPFCLWDPDFGGPVLGMVMHGDSSALPWSNRRFVPKTVWVACRSRGGAEKLLRAAQAGYEARAFPAGRLRFHLAMVTAHWSWWAEHPHPPVDLAGAASTAPMRRFRRDLAGFFGRCRAEWDPARRAKHKMVCLLHGPPGGGKTHCVKLAAAENGVPLYDINLGSGRVDDFSLQLLQVSATPAPKILLLDEFDAVTERGHLLRRSMSDGQETREHRQPSKAGWHKLLDCEVLDNVVVALVTNRTEGELAHIFGPAFLRSMRVDRTYRLGAVDDAFLAQACRGRGIDPPLRTAGDRWTVADVAAALDAGPATAAALAGRLRSAAERRAAASDHRAAEDLCAALGVPADRFLLPLAKHGVVDMATLLWMDRAALRDRLELSVGRADELARALDRHEERALPGGGECAKHPRSELHLVPETPGTVYRRLVRAARRQGGGEHLDDDPRVLPADRVWRLPLGVRDATTSPSAVEGGSP